MNLDRLEEELRSQISILEYKESRLKDWLQSADHSGCIDGWKDHFRFEGDDSNFISELLSGIDSAVLDKERVKQREICLPTLNSEKAFDERINGLRKDLSLGTVKRNWRQRFGLEKPHVV